MAAGILLLLLRKIKHDYDHHGNKGVIVHSQQIEREKDSSSRD